MTRATVKMGRKARLTAQDIGKIVDATLHTRPAAATHWSCRTMAKAQGVSQATLNRIWQGHHLQPHRTRNFKLSRDPKFLEKLSAVSGLGFSSTVIPTASEASSVEDLIPTPA